MSEETLQAIENCGAAEMPTAETCAIAEITEAEYWASPEAQKRYRIGQLRTKLEMRQAVIKMAKNGNPQMVKVYQDFIAENAADLPPMKTPDGEDGGEFDGI
jgi:hypothetical protein